MNYNDLLVIAVRILELENSTRRVLNIFDIQGGTGFHRVFTTVQKLPLLYQYVIEFHEGHRSIADILEKMRD